MMSPRCLRSLRSAAAVCLWVCLWAFLPACSLLPHHRETPLTPATSEPVVGRTSSPRGLTVELKAAPDPVKLGEVRQIDVTFVLRNNSKQNMTLKFATSQTFEILLREQGSGKVVSQWSTEQTFQPATRFLVINPHERIEYNQPITTRELHAGTTYQLEAYFIGYEKELHTTRPVIPLP